MASRRRVIGDGCDGRHRLSLAGLAAGHTLSVSAADAASPRQPCASCSAVRQDRQTSPTNVEARRSPPSSVQPSPDTPPGPRLAACAQCGRPLTLLRSRRLSSKVDATSRSPGAGDEGPPIRRVRQCLGKNQARSPTRVSSDCFDSSRARAGFRRRAIAGSCRCAGWVCSSRDWRIKDEAATLSRAAPIVRRLLFRFPPRQAFGGGDGGVAVRSGGARPERAPRARVGRAAGAGDAPRDPDRSADRDPRGQRSAIAAMVGIDCRHARRTAAQEPRSRDAGVIGRYLRPTAAAAGPITKMVLPNGSSRSNVRAFHSSSLGGRGGRRTSTFALHSR